jgi:hypothetical protein
MKFDIHELNDVELSSVYGGRGGGDNGSGDSGVVDALNGVLDGNDIGVAANILGFQNNAQDTQRFYRGGDDDD